MHQPDGAIDRSMIDPLVDDGSAPPAGAAVKSCRLPRAGQSAAAGPV